MIISNDFPKRCSKKKREIEMAQILQRVNLKASISNIGLRSSLTFFFPAVLITYFVPGDTKVANALVHSVLKKTVR